MAELGWRARSHESRLPSGIRLLAPARTSHDSSGKVLLLATSPALRIHKQLATMIQYGPAERAKRLSSAGPLRERWREEGALAVLDSEGRMMP